MNTLRIVSLLVTAAVVPTGIVQARVLQSSIDGGELWAVQEGSLLRIGGPEEGEVRVEVPIGAQLRDLEPVAGGWVAAGRVASERGVDLLLLESGAEGTDLLAPPEASGGRYRGHATLFIDDGELVGLAWAEGDDPRRFEIRASVRTDRRWEAVELVSPAGPGSQVAPVGAVLDDGTWLLVWAAYDGEDHEIVWSRRMGGEWSSPESLHPDNEVPDVTPDLVAVDGGALVVWSWFDGHDYRLRSARWFGAGWEVEESFGGRGSGEPLLLRTEDGAVLLFSSVQPAAWTVVELDGSGVYRRREEVSGDRVERPLLLLGAPAGDRLRWSSEEVTLDWQGRP